MVCFAFNYFLSFFSKFATRSSFFCIFVLSLWLLQDTLVYHNIFFTMLLFVCFFCLLLSIYAAKLKTALLKTRALRAANDS